MSQATTQPGLKVFVLGLHKTGTSSFKVAMEAEGFRVANYFGIDDPTISQTGLDQALKQIPEYDAFQDDPWWMFYKEMHLQIPNSKFILTYRDSDKWYESALKHFAGDKDNEVRKWFYGNDKADPTDNREHWIACKEKHEQAVRDYFAQFPDIFLEMDITAGDDWTQLGPFLGHKPSSTKFPRTNTATMRLGHRAKLEHNQSTGLKRIGLKFKVWYYHWLDRMK